MQKFIIEHLSSVTTVYDSQISQKLEIEYEARRKILNLGFPTRSDTNQAVQPQEMVRCQEFQIYKAERLYYLHVCTCSENKGADQL